jgi:GTP-binding protein HflX
MFEVFEEDRPKKAILLAVLLPGVDDEALRRSVEELRRLAKTLGVEVTGEITQRRDTLDPGTVVGKGKLEEIKRLIETEVGNLVLVDHEISPSQARNLEKATEADVLDRTAVILEIFHRHARSRAARAQVEMVRLKYMAPRLREQGKAKSGDRQRGGIGGKGAGESALELDRRKIRDRMAELEQEIEQIEEERKTQRSRRMDLSRVALVGYTNAGKSTLMRALTGSDVYIADKLFATLDTTVRVLHPVTHPRVLVSDTVGFIDKLPHDLVASFKSTLDEALEASLLAQVIDCSDPAYERELQVTLEVLQEIGAGEIPRLTIFNKIDRIGDAAAQEARRAELQARWPGCIVMSAKVDADVAALRETFVAFFAKDLVELEIRLGWDQQSRRAEIFDRCQVLEESYDENGAILKVKAPKGFRIE